eukprot:2752834-Lingulodinium_polyedra.AAC.1
MGAVQVAIVERACTVRVSSRVPGSCCLSARLWRRASTSRGSRRACANQDGPTGSRRGVERGAGVCTSQRV